MAADGFEFPVLPEINGQPVGELLSKMHSFFDDRYHLNIMLLNPFLFLEFTRYTLRKDNEWAAYYL